MKVKAASAGASKTAINRRVQKIVAAFRGLAIAHDEAVQLRRFIVGERV
jgi:hypothetical protein